MASGECRLRKPVDETGAQAFHGRFFGDALLRRDQGPDAGDEPLAPGLVLDGGDQGLQVAQGNLGRSPRWGRAAVCRLPDGGRRQKEAEYQDRRRG